MENIFEKYSSNTLSAGGNQVYMFDNVPNGMGEGLVFVKVFRSGTFRYRFVYSGVIDGTYSEGDISRCNSPCDWTIESLGAAVADGCTPGDLKFSKVLFDGNESIFVGSSKYVVSDAVELTAEKNEYICLKIRFSGEKIPCHKESIIPVYRMTEKGWELCPEVPVPVFTGIDFEPERRVAFLGDSITQGIGSTFNSYRNFAAVSAESIGESYSYWNLGLGYGRASDAASDGIWLEKAKTNDIVVLCYGVNDLFREFNEEKLKKDLTKIVDELQKCGTKVLIQTIPPFDYDEKHAKAWMAVNDYIRNVLAEKTDGLFDCVPVLSRTGGNVPEAGYGPHPDDEGCCKWAAAIVPEILRLL